MRSDNEIVQYAAFLVKTYTNNGLRKLLSLRCLVTLFFFHSSLFTFALPLHLFNAEMRQAAGRQALIMDFVERYFGDYFTKNKTEREIQMTDDKVFFRKGKPEDLRHLADTIPFTITFHEKYYEVNWFVAEEPFITLVFPAQYDLILGLSQKDIQEHTRDYILAAPPRDSILHQPDTLQPFKDDVLVCKHAFMELESLTDATYYIYTKVSEAAPQPVFDVKHIDLSAANLFAGLIRNKDYRLYVEQAAYSQKLTYTLPFSQWLNYCAEQQLQVFFAVEEVREDGVLALVIAHNKELNYNHLLSVVIPDKFVEHEGCILKAKMTPFIPTHNIKNLYQQYSPKSKKTQWQ